MQFPRLRFVLSSAALLAATATVSTGLATPGTAAQSGRPVLAVQSNSDSVTLRQTGSGRVFLRLRTYVVAGDLPFEVWAGRTSYSRPIEASQRPRNRHIDLEELDLKNFQGLPAFFRTVVRKEDGDVAVNRVRPFCPNNWDPTRRRVDAPHASPYPNSCPWWRLTLGTVFGVQAGWSVPTGDAGVARLAPGRYSATVRITRRYRQMFDIPEAAATRSVELTVVDQQATCADCASTAETRRVDARAEEPLQPRASRPADSSRPPAGGAYLPDLRSLPAFDIGVHSRPRTKRDFLAFGANVWNAGMTHLVVDGFRREGEELMDAYQYFYDRDGELTGHARTGTFEWDQRDGHHHWHFTDFARYRLLDATKTSVVRSHKQSFCLVNTDAIDYTVPGALWQPEKTDLHSDCPSNRNATSFREALASGSGDTYYQGRAGQSFNITSLPNGTYYVEVAANPARRLYESDDANNVSYRRVILGGEPGARTVRVPPIVFYR
ncbi:MAG: lysyl oxidase family protein [Nocardioidaceae bacterium]